MYRFPLLILCCWLPLAALAAEPTPENRSIQRHTINIGKLRKSIRTHQGKVTASEQQSKTLLQELEELDRTIELKQAGIRKIREQIQRQDLLILRQEERLQEIDRQKKELQQHLLNRLKAYYFRGNSRFLNVTFSDTNLPDILLFEDAFRSLVTYDRSVFAAYRAKKSQILQAKQANELEKTVKADFLSQAGEEKKALDFIAAEKQALLKQTKKRKDLYAQALVEMHKAELGLTSTIKELRRKKERKTKGFLLSKGQLKPPVGGRLVSGFKRDENGALSHGITIKAENGARVEAVFKGRVLYAGYMRGFGKTVIIDHGLEYYSVTSRLDRLQVHKGEQVGRGQTIGTTGNIATLFGRGLYFEIRHGSSAEDPTAWFTPGALLADSAP
ncbi:murein hydrolase activator EnvC family protein [Desulfogranum mediterraneum]|uniref:murein hydrolase activator EnvC family protein n=1 Tax=Desulfogranum mediterraneum TaxID=160661 RepID=UPI000417995A|nr:peptidoglycan DD-metalloendopeptidase family protein [Desulfogranum mediterraneum]